MWVKRNGAPSIQVLKKIRAAYNIDIDVLAGDDEPDTATSKNGKKEASVENAVGAGEQGKTDVSSVGISQSHDTNCLEYSMVLIKIRNQKKWTHEQVADKIGASPNMVLAIEHGDCEPSLDVIDKIKSLMCEIRVYEPLCMTPEESGYDLLPYLIASAENDTNLPKDIRDIGERINPNFWDNLKNRHIRYRDVAHLRKMLARYKIDECRFFAYCAVNPILVIDDDLKQEDLTIELYNHLLRMGVDGHEWKAKGDGETDRDGSAPNHTVLSVLERAVSLAEAQRTDSKETTDRLLEIMQRDKEDWSTDRGRLLTIIDNLSKNSSKKVDTVCGSGSGSGGNKMTVETGAQ